MLKFLPQKLTIYKLKERNNSYNFNNPNKINWKEKITIKNESRRRIETVTSQGAGRSTVRRHHSPNLLLGGNMIAYCGHRQRNNTIAREYEYNPVNGGYETRQKRRVGRAMFSIRTKFDVALPENTTYPRRYQLHHL